MVPVFTDSVKEKCLGPFQISEADVIEVFSKPEQSQVIELEGDGKSTTMMFLGQTAQGEIILVVGEPDDQTLTVHTALKVPASIAGPAGAMEPPLKVLEQLAQRFGFGMIVGDRICRFLLNEKIPIKDPRQIGLAKIQNYGGGPFYLTWKLRVVRRADQWYADCALCYAIDLNTYRQAIGAIPAPVQNGLPPKCDSQRNPVIIEPDARRLMSHIKLSDQRVIEAVCNPTRGMADNTRATGIRWFDDGQIVFFEGAVAKSRPEGPRRRIQQIQVNLAIPLRQQLPAGELKRDDPLTATLAIIVASFGLPLQCHPDFGFSKLYSGPWDGKKPRMQSREKDDLLLIRGAFNTFNRTCNSVWAFSSNTYTRWWDSLRLH